MPSAMMRAIGSLDPPAAGWEFVAFVEMVMATINRALANVPRDRGRLHVCWGNSESPHDADVPLADILPALQQANVGGFVLPFADPRHAHEFRCFEQHPLKDDQILVAGVIDSLTNFVERPEVVADRLDRVAAVVRAGGRIGLRATSQHVAIWQVRRSQACNRLLLLMVRVTVARLASSCGACDAMPEVPTREQCSGWAV
jgi:methionine synthase II (cobalamin-independent)